MSMQGHRKCQVRCPDCGNERQAWVDHVKRGRVRCRSCAATRHGGKGTQLYQRWEAMKRRCHPGFHQRADYFDRGIRVCPEWGGFAEFARWAMSHGYAPELTLDRIDNDGGYTPENCRWVPRTVQMRNTRHLMSTNTSGYRGVSLHQGARWRAGITVDGRHVYLGLHETAEQAAETYDLYVMDNELEHTTNGLLEDSC